MKLTFFQRVDVEAENIEEDRVETELVLSLEDVDLARVAIARLVIPKANSLLQLRFPHAVRHRRFAVQA